MRQAMRRTIGLGGAAFVAVGAALVLTLPASAHNPVWTAACNSDGQVVVSLSLNSYATSPKATGNKVGVVDQDGNTVIATHAFGASDNSTSAPLAGNKDYTFTMTIFAQDDPKGKNHGNGTPDQFDGTFTKMTYKCPTPPPPTTTTKVPPPTTTTTMAPPTTTTTMVAPTTTGGATTTTAVVAAATTASGSGTLPFTGVNAGFPLLIAGVLVIAGGGILFWLRLAAKRRRTES